MKPLVSKRGSQEVTVERKNGVIVIRAYDKMKHTANTVSIFDELLAGLILGLVSLRTRAAEQRNEADGELAGKAPNDLSTEDK